MLIHNAFTILSQAYTRIGAMGLEMIRVGDTPRQPTLMRTLIISTELFSTIMEQVLINDAGDGIAGVIGDNYDALNSLILWLKKETDVSGIGFPTPLNTRVVTEGQTPGPPGESITGPPGADGAAYDFSKLSQGVGTVVVDRFANTDGKRATWEYNIYDESLDNMRTGTIKGIWNTVFIKFAEAGSPNIIGIQPDVVLSVEFDGTDIILQAVISSGTWSIDGERRFTPTNGSGNIVSTSLADANVFIGGADGVAHQKAVTGPVRITRDGLTSIQNQSITNPMIVDDAGIEFDKMENLAALIGLGTNSLGRITPLTGAITTVLFSNLGLGFVIVSDPVTGKIIVSGITLAKLNYLSDVLAPIQGQLTGKQNTITGAASSATVVNFTADKVVSTNAGGKFEASDIDIADLENIINGTPGPTISEPLITQIMSLALKTLIATSETKTFTAGVKGSRIYLVQFIGTTPASTNKVTQTFGGDTADIVSGDGTTSAQNYITVAKIPGIPTEVTNGSIAGAPFFPIGAGVTVSIIAQFAINAVITYVDLE